MVLLGCPLLLSTLFLVLQTEKETEKHKVKGEELEYKENTLKLLELPTILINCIGHF